MKKYILILLLIQIQLLSFAQTKPKRTLDETVNWVVEKLNAISIKNFTKLSNDVTTYNYDKNFSFNKDSLSIEYMNEYQGYTNVGNTPMTYSYYSIRLDDISQIEYHVNDKISVKPTLLIIANNKTISLKDFRGKILDYNNEVYIHVDISKQENLIERMKKAFADIKTHFPKKEEAY